MAVTLSAAEKATWRQTHIPHRIRGMLVGTGLYADVGGDATKWPAALDQNPVQRRLITDAAWEARIACLRWVIEFIGIAINANGPARPRRRPDDIGIEQFDAMWQYDLNGLHARRFAATWEAASKATAHGTSDKPHPLLQDQAPDGTSPRNDTTKMLIDYLDSTLYAAEPNWLRKYVFTES